MPLILPIPTANADNLGASVYKLMQISSIVNKSEENDIVLDFCHTKFQFSCFLAGLFIMAKEWRKSGKSVTIININDGIYAYLQTINFQDGYTHVEGRDLSYYHRKTFTPLFIFSTNAHLREQCIQTVLDIVIEQTHINGADCRNVVDYFISELTNNVADHSESEHGIVIAQSYPSKNFMDITIADCGIGIFNSYSKTDKFNPQNEAEAIEMAVNGRSTKDIAESRGFGLSGSRSLLVKGLNGMFCLWSGYYIFLDGAGVKNILKTEDGARMQGCYLNLRLPLNSVLKGNFYDYIS